MKIKILDPSPLEAKNVDMEDADDEGYLVCASSVQYSKSQRSLFTLPFQVESDSGIVLDRGYLTLNVRTGKLGVEHRLEEIVSPVDEKVAPVDEETEKKPKSKGKSDPLEG